MDIALRIHHFLPSSRANGPGRRAVIWVQGCSLNCPGCFNPQTHSPDGGTVVPVADLFRRIVALGDGIEGISISGGEPLEQPRSLLALIERLRRETALSALLFTGYTWAEIEHLPGARDVLACVDVLVAGRYDASHSTTGGLCSSSNQTLHLLTDRYTMDDLQAVPPAEVIITPDGEVVLSGTNPLIW